VAKIKILFCENEARENIFGAFIHLGSSDYLLDSIIVDDYDSDGEALDKLDMFVEYWNGLADFQKFEFEISKDVDSFIDGLRINVEEELDEDGD